MSKEKDKVEIIKDQLGFKGVKINDLIHLYFNDVILAINSYVDSDSKPEKRYWIEFYLASGHVVTSEYDDRELWETILKGLE